MGATSGLCAGAALANKLTEHRTAAKEWRMGWAFLPQKNESNTIILILLRDAVNAKRGDELRILYRASGQELNLFRGFRVQVYDTLNRPRSECECMKSKRASILLPHETARELVRRKRLLRFLESGIPAWKDADHPELACDAARWVRELREESERKRAQKQRREGKRNP